MPERIAAETNKRVAVSAVPDSNPDWLQTSSKKELSQTQRISSQVPFQPHFDSV